MIRHRLLALSVFAFVLLPGVAHAGTLHFTGQLAAGSAINSPPTLTLADGRISGSLTQVHPTACAAPADWAQSDDSVFKLSLPATPVSGGRFHFAGPAPSAYYGAGGAAKPYGGQYTIDGTVAPDHSLITATIMLSGAQDPFVTGCSGTYHLIAIPTVHGGARRPARSDYQSQFVWFTDDGGVVRNLHVTANFTCGASIDQAQVDATALGDLAIRTTAGGHFALRVYALDEYQHIVIVSVSGHVAGKTAKGRTTVSEPAGGYRGEANDACHGSRSWTAALPVPPAPPGPSADFRWAAIRVPAGTAFHYYFAIQDLSCSHGATEVLATVAGHTTTIPCSRSIAYASPSLSPGRTYEVTAQAVRTRGARVVKRGTAATYPLAMPDAGDYWRPVSGLPAPPRD